MKMAKPNCPLLQQINYQTIGQIILKTSLYFLSHSRNTAYWNVFLQIKVWCIWFWW